MKKSENWIISKLFNNNNSSRPAYSLVWVRRKNFQHYKRSRLRYFIFKVVTLIKPEMYNILIATSQHTSLFFPLRSFLLPTPTALLRPVADSGLVKSSNLSYTWHSRGSLRCRDSDSLRSRRLKVVGERENGRARGRLAHLFFLVPTTSKRQQRESQKGNRTNFRPAENSNVHLKQP